MGEIDTDVVLGFILGFVYKVKLRAAVAWTLYAWIAAMIKAARSLQNTTT